MPIRAAMSDSGVMTAVRTSLSLIVRTLPSTWLKRGSMKTRTKPGCEATTSRSSSASRGRTNSASRKKTRDRSAPATSSRGRRTRRGVVLAGDDEDVARRWARGPIGPGGAGRDPRDEVHHRGRLGLAGVAVEEGHRAPRQPALPEPLDGHRVVARHRPDGGAAGHDGRGGHELADEVGIGVGGIPARLGTQGRLTRPRRGRHALERRGDAPPCARGPSSSWSGQRTTSRPSRTARASADGMTPVPYVPDGAETRGPDGIRGAFALDDDDGSLVGEVPATGTGPGARARCPSAPTRCACPRPSSVRQWWPAIEPSG